MLFMAMWALILLSNAAANASSSSEVKQCYDGFLWDIQQQMCLPICFDGPITTKNLSTPKTNRICASSQNFNFSAENSTMLMQTNLPRCFNLTLHDATIMNLSYDKRMEFAKSARNTPHTDVVTTCYPYSNYLKQCQNLLVLQSNETLFFPENLTLLDVANGHHFALGDYIILEDVAIACSDTRPAQKRFCQPTPVSSTEYTLTTPHNGLFLQWRNETLPFAEYETSGPSGFITLCYPFSEAFRKCIRFDIPLEDVIFLENRSLYHTTWNTMIELGDYFNYSDTSVALCVPVRVAPVPFNVYRIHGILYIISAVCLVITVFIHVVFPNTNRHAKPLLFYGISLTITYIGLAWQVYAGGRTEILNLVIFGILHYFILATFFWLNILAFDLWHNFSNLKSITGSISCINCQTLSCEGYQFHCYSMYAWLIPAAITASAFALEFNPEAQKILDMPIDISAAGWFQDTLTTFVLLFGPLAIILLENLIMFLLTVWNLHEASRGAQLVNKKLNRQMIIVFAKLFVVMGMFWSIELISWATGGNRQVWQVPDLINASLGIIIFVIFICKPSTLKMVMGKITEKRCISATPESKTTDIVLSSQSNLQSIQRKFSPTL